MDDASAALLALGRLLRASSYRFVTVTPEIHRRVNARAGPARSLRDVFGWSRPFAPEVLPPAMLDLLAAADALAVVGTQLRATVRFSSLGGRLFAHSAYPTVEGDAVFFGPDTYRFCALVGRAVGPCRRVVDVGCGSGAGGLTAATHASEIVLADVSPKALRFARVNAALAGVEVESLGRRAVAAFDLHARFFHQEFFRRRDGSLLALEMNLRPPGGFTTDLMNYACDVDVYELWAAVVTGAPLDDFAYERRYHTAHAGRRDRAYALPADALVRSLGPTLVARRPVPKEFAATMGDEAYLLRHPDLAALRAAIADVQRPA